MRTFPFNSDRLLAVAIVGGVVTGVAMFFGLSFTVAVGFWLGLMISPWVLVLEGRG